MPTCPQCRTRYPDDVATCANDGETLLPDEAFTSVDPDLPVGETVGEYRIEGKLGEGGFGAVYKAMHPLIGKHAAVKVLNRQYSSNPQMVSRFIAEARAVNQIRHKNIIDIFSFGTLPDGRQYFVMELLEGMPFDRFLDQHGRLPPEVALPILRAVGRALDAAHGHHIVHRDLKPENIYLTFDEDGGIHPKLLDFGIAKLTGEASGGHKTRTGTPMGTPNYMSPEQCRGQKVDQRTDIYSLGCMCHQVLTGRLPFEGEAIMDVLVQHMTADPPPMSKHCPELTTALDAPVLAMLAKDPAARPASAGAAIEALLRAAKDAGIAVPGGAPAPSAALPRLSNIRPPSSSKPQLTPQELEQLAQAKTLAHPSDPPGGRGRTLTPSEQDVAPKPRSRALVWGGALAGLVVVLGVATVVGLKVIASPSPGAAASAASAPARPTATAQAASTVQAASTAGASPSVALVPATVEITLHTTPPHAIVFEGGQRLGRAPGPFAMPHGTEKITLTIKAEGYAPQTMDVVPDHDQVMTATLQKQTAGAPAGQATATATATHKDYENPFR